MSNHEIWKHFKYQWKKFRQRTKKEMMRYTTEYSFPTSLLIHALIGQLPLSRHIYKPTIARHVTCHVVWFLPPSWQVPIYKTHGAKSVDGGSFKDFSDNSHLRDRWWDLSQSWQISLQISILVTRGNQKWYQPFRATSGENCRCVF